VTPLNREPILAGMAGMASLAGMVGHSPLLRDVARQIERVAPYFRTALITGETGTGKELAAQALHAARPGNPGQLIALNCSAVVETLFESELFGHVRGAFTDACRDKAGLFEMAHQGTLFLDEIGDLPLPTQAKLLRVVQQQEVLRVGSVTPRKVDVRIIAATNRDLRQEVQAKRFREDLYYRLSMLELEMPPLRQRMDDVPELARHFAAGWAAQWPAGERDRRRSAGPSGRSHLARQCPRVRECDGLRVHAGRRRNHLAGRFAQVFARTQPQPRIARVFTCAPGAQRRRRERTGGVRAAAVARSAAPERAEPVAGRTRAPNQP